MGEVIRLFSKLDFKLSAYAKKQNKTNNKDQHEYLNAFDFC